MNKGMDAVVYPVSDLARARDIFSRLLGVEPHTDEPYYVGFRVADQEIGLDPNGHKRGMTGATPMWGVDDIREAVTALTAAGVTVVEDVRDVGGGNLIALLRDADGNMIGIGQTP